MLSQLLNKIPRPLPVGLAEFEKFAARIIAQAGPYADKDSMTFAIATSIIHADAHKGYLPDEFFLLRLRKAAANQIASQVFQDIKLKQQEAAKAALEAKQLAQAEVTATETTTSDGKEN